MGKNKRGRKSNVPNKNSSKRGDSSKERNETEKDKEPTEVETKMEGPPVNPPVSSEDQANIEKVFSALNVSPQPKNEDHVPAVVDIDEQEKLEKESDEESFDDASYEETFMSREEPAGENQEDAASRVSSKTDVCVNSEVETEQEQQGTTNFSFERPDSQIQVERTAYTIRYHQKFGDFLELIHPETRHCASVGPPETFDSEGVKSLIENMEAVDGYSSWPFSKKFETSAQDNKSMMKDLCNEIADIIKQCVIITCAQKGYELQSKRNIGPLSVLWKDELDPLVELKTIIAIAEEIQTAIVEIELECEENRFWADVKNYKEVIIPALETFDSETLASNGIMDRMNTLHGRVELGFEVPEQEIDQLLESLTENEFGPLVAIVQHCPQIFKTVKQLKLIFPHLRHMSKLIDIRIKQSGVQAIVQIISALNHEQIIEVFDMIQEAEKIPLKVFGLDADTFEPIGSKNEAKQSIYFKLFYWPYKKKENHQLTEKELLDALLCFYLICPAVDVNTFIFKILSVNMVNKNEDFMSDRENLVKALLSLPLQLRERLEIGEEFSKASGTLTEESMYFQVKRALQIGTARHEISDYANKIEWFFHTPKDHPKLILVERVMRMMMDGVEQGAYQKMSVEGLKVLLREKSLNFELPSLFFEDLLFLALQKYSIPDVQLKKSPEGKYLFMESMFKIAQKFKDEAGLEINYESLKDKWSNIGHHWYSLLYLTYRFPILKAAMPSFTLPWFSSDGWSDQKPEVQGAAKYAIMARVLSAWPDCTDMDMLTVLVAEHIPHDVNRSDLYKEMRDYVAESENFNEYHQKDLIRKFDEKITFLMSKAMKKEEEESEEKVDEEKKEQKNKTNPAFYETFYDENMWKSWPPSITDEVKRLRKLHNLQVVDGKLVPL